MRQYVRRRGGAIDRPLMRVARPAPQGRRLHILEVPKENHLLLQIRGAVRSFFLTVRSAHLSAHFQGPLF